MIEKRVAHLSEALKELASKVADVVVDVENMQDRLSKVDSRFDTIHIDNDAIREQHDELKRQLERVLKNVEFPTDDGR